ncbi:MAG: ABC transporter ATP-binding protein [Planctomycetota bacterium]|jgi:putative ABC transport system ATP-binding protein
MALAELRNIWKTYEMGSALLHALRGITFAIEQGEMISIMGPSGSGKSTLLNLLGCLDTPTQGEYLLGGRDVSTLTDDELSEIRASQIGFIFQSYNLITQLNVVENIEIPLYYRGISERESYERAVELAARVGLSHRLGHVPTELSGGERQRVGIARALASSPLIVLADEPTGNLDTRTGAQILELLQGLNQDGVTMIVVTHDPRISAATQRVLSLVDGTITEQAEEGDIAGTRE